jgi:pyruvate/2-oxoglutarate dehydrogenase complex dihydrolipoamide dehydrogenase (E3) component
MSQTFDAIIIGAGQAGPPLAGRLTAAGKKVALVERKLFGGTCVNTGCIPTKTMIASARTAHVARRAAEYGVNLAGPVGVDMGRVKARKDQISGTSRKNIESWLGGMNGCTIFRGHARFEAPDAVRVGNELLSAGWVFINVGGRAHIPAMPGLDQVKLLTNSTMLDLDALPHHLVVVGGSYVGLEFAQMYRRFGSSVTVVEKSGRLIGHEDPDVSDAVKDILEGEGINVRLNAECIHFAPHGNEIAVGVNCISGGPEEIGTHVLLAVGRIPNTSDLGLEKAGVEIDDRGYIRVDDQLRTSVEGVWALGDCNGRGAFTHTAYNDFEIVSSNLLDHASRSVSDRITAYALFIDPPLGRAGMTAEAVRKSGRRALAAMMPMTRVGRAVEKGETQGFMKIIADADTKQILGAAILGTGGDEAIHCILDMMYAKAPYPTLRQAVNIHPTVSELIPTMLAGLTPLT